MWSFLWVTFHTHTPSFFNSSLMEILIIFLYNGINTLIIIIIIIFHSALSFFFYRMWVHCNFVCVCVLLGLQMECIMHVYTCLSLQPIWLSSPHLGALGSLGGLSRVCFPCGKRRSNVVCKSPCLQYLDPCMLGRVVNGISCRQPVLMSSVLKVSFFKKQQMMAKTSLWDPLKNCSHSEQATLTQNRQIVWPGIRQDSIESWCGRADCMYLGCRWRWVAQLVRAHHTKVGSLIPIRDSCVFLHFRGLGQDGSQDPLPTLQFCDISDCSPMKHNSLQRENRKDKEIWLLMATMAMIHLCCHGQCASRCPLLGIKGGQGAVALTGDAESRMLNKMGLGPDPAGLQGKHCAATFFPELLAFFVPWAS